VWIKWIEREVKRKIGFPENQEERGGE